MNTLFSVCVCVCARVRVHYACVRAFVPVPARPLPQAPPVRSETSCTGAADRRVSIVTRTTLAISAALGVRASTPAYQVHFAQHRAPQCYDVAGAAKGGRGST